MAAILTVLLDILWGGFSLRFRNATSGALGDLDTLVDTGKIMVRVAYGTAS